MKSLKNFGTHRLAARYLGDEDFTELCLMHSNPSVMATLGGVRSDDETIRFMREKMAHWQSYGFGYWIFREKISGRFVGRGGIQHIDVGGNQEIEIGYSVVTDYWGQGMATEMAESLVAISFEQLAQTEIVCFTLSNNLPSQRVMQKVGFVFERAIIHEDEPHVLYRLKYEEYMANKRSQAVYHLI